MTNDIFLRRGKAFTDGHSMLRHSRIHAVLVMHAGRLSHSLVAYYAIGESTQLRDHIFVHVGKLSQKPVACYATGELIQLRNQIFVMHIINTSEKPMTC